MDPTINPGSLRDARLSRAKGRAQLARECNVSRASVGHWETGLYVPSGPSRLALSRALRYPLAVVDGWFPGEAAS